MSATTLLFGFMPLVAFVVIDSFAGIKSGVIAAVIFAVIEAAYTVFTFGSIDGITLGTLLLVGIFGFLSFKTQKSIYFKIQPVVLGLLMGGTLLVMQMIDKPLLVLMAQKYQYAVPEEIKTSLSNPIFIGILTKLSGILAFGFILHASAVAYAAFYLSKWWWLGIRGVGLYVMMGICMFWARFF
ncbi:MAG: septation protein IspZ [Deltaproteobacteria bacterium]|nr:septation protein IspZ [Deltaproteobacteria bacterium]